MGSDAAMQHCAQLLSSFAGKVEGRIVWPMRGRQGHGYDPVFQPDGYDTTFAEMGWDEKNRISHRADAFAKLVAALGN